MTLLARLVKKRRDAKSEAARGHRRVDACAEEPEGPRDLNFAPVKIALSDEGEVQIVTSVSQIVEYLTMQWPVPYGDAFEEALQACIDGVQGRISPQQVRSAFTKAAKAAGLRIVP
ncbi:MAG: DUF982 domain-containing protein [Rhizobium sp.]|nr:MAG: DUF982 domain-containing protein [Rhizobium sp.]